MKIGIIGTGSVAARLQALFSKAGHDVVLGSRSPAASQVTHREVCVERDVIVLAIPFVAVEGVVGGLKDAIGSTVVVDATNPLNDDWSPYPLGEDNSAGETIQRVLPEAKVVKGFNTIFADIMTTEGVDREGRSATAFLAGDDQAAVERVAELANSIGFQAVPTGPLKNSRYLEAMAHLNIAIAVVEGGGTGAAFIYDRG
ncbi:MAG: NAD(P)-binding domain-containing protein [Pseudomonadota bacterium]